MDFILFLLSLLTVLFNGIDCRLFRSDYQFYQEVDGWVKLHQVPAPWEDARLRCELEGAILASPHTRNLESIMRRVMANTHSEASGVFTGVHATFSKGDFYSVDGIPLSKMPVQWMPSEPDNQNNAESCIVMVANGTIADVSCYDVYPYVCFKKRTKNMIMNVCGTTDPEYKLNEQTGHCYKFHLTPRNWTRAFMVCSAEGAHLAIINSDEEAGVLKELHGRHKADDLPYDTIFLGFQDWGENGVWTTIHGQSLADSGYAKFQPGQPDNASPGENCGSMFRNGYFNDAWCYVKLAFICEKTVDSLMDDMDV
ncbi:macrophage mannose receptor 1-like [Zerene cesonia]|uniref:macrophage mannose receptor 1-like n=1 Tax=Zerene cesonia TaxID=33412 RepID=UPI0018E5209C|nr:macrophage mannose receptor 1-like [Zerene cesonia]